jgi:hypothetical protein
MRATASSVHQRGSHRGSTWISKVAALPAQKPGLQPFCEVGATGLEPATSGVQDRRRYSTSPDSGRQLDLNRPHSTPIDTNRQVRSHRARTTVVGAETMIHEAPANRQFLVMERAGFEPAAFGLQTHPITLRRLTPTNKIGMTEPYSAISSNVT